MDSSKKIFISLSIFVISFFHISAQSFVSSPPDIDSTVIYGGNEDDFGYAIEEVPGGYIICGGTQSYGSGGMDVCLIRTNGLNSIPLRRKTFGGSQSDCGYSLKVTDDRGYIVCGYTESYGSGGADVYLVKTDSLGDSIWAKTFGGSEDDYGNSVDVTDDGGYIICGYTESFGAGGRDVYLIRTNSSGDSLWARTYGGMVNDEGASVKQTKDKGFIITGETYSFAENWWTCPDIYLIKTDSLGDSIWARPYGCEYYDFGYSVIETSDDGYVVGGGMEPAPSMAQICLLKTDSLGDSLWCCFCDGGAGCLNSVIETKNHDYVMTGIVFAEGSFFLAKVNPSGDLLWSNNIGGEFDIAEGHSVRQTSDGGYIAVGTCENFDRAADIWVVKIAPDESGIFERETEDRDIYLRCNPVIFSNITEILYTVKSESANIEIAVFDVCGNRLKTILSGMKTEGHYTTSWNGTADNGYLLPNGVYFLRFATGNSIADMAKLILLR